VTFNIGRQDANIVNNVGGDQYNTGQYVVSGQREALELLHRLRSELDSIEMPATLATQAKQAAQQAEDVLAQRDPDKELVSRHLRAVATSLKEASGVLDAGRGIGRTLAELGRWLGPAGVALLSLL
jgi:HPt (histidine-containing phosphotransfer) domain-containing protein